MKQNKTKKPSLIKNKVNPGLDIAQSVKAYINCHGHNQEAPFNQQPQVKSSQPHKVSLTDWRKLYHLSKRKTTPHHKQLVKRRVYTSMRNPTHHSFNRKTFQTRNSYRTNLDADSFQSKRKESQIDSAIVQNFYETDLSLDRRVKTSKIKKHYQNQHEARPSSINFSRRNMYSERVQLQDDEKDKNKRIIKKKQNINTLMKSVCTVRYQKVVLRQKHFLKNEDLRVENISLKEINSIQGMRYVH